MGLRRTGNKLRTTVHPAAEQPAVAPGLCDQLPRTRESRAHGGAEPLAEADADRVERLGPSVSGDARGGHCVELTRPVQVGLQWTRSATWLVMVPEGMKIAASWPRIAAMRRWSLSTVGSASITSSPTSARAMASRIPGVGRVTVSLRRSTGSSLIACVPRK